jgi:two-component system chemotaxis sensor kinase CheA
VREAVEKLAGDVDVQSQAGIGAAFTIIAPMSLAALDVLIVEAGQTIAMVPFDAVRRSMMASPADISTTGSGAVVIHDGAAIPFTPLSLALHGTRPAAGRAWPALVIAGAEGLAAIGVDRLHGSAKVVMRPPPRFAPANPLVAGAALDADGNPQLVLDPDGLVAAARRAGAAQPQAPTAPAPVLVVDDSLTTRMLEQSILESAGFEVELAISAEEALECVRRKPYALILVDVEMPGMDGFTFVERIRLDPAHSATPAILLTSRDDPEDHQRGREVGAQAYMVKSRFDQAELLATIRRLIG